MLLEIIEKVLGMFPEMAIASAFIAVFIDLVLKKLLKMPDGYAGLAAGVLNAIVWIAVMLAGDAAVGDIKNILDALTLLLPYIVAALLGLIGSDMAHTYAVTKGLRVGFSYSRGD